MSSDNPRTLKIIFIADGDTDYLFLEKMFREDPDLSSLPITIVRPEHVKLTRRTGGGHTTLLKFIGFAAMRAAQGHADGVFALVDNDGDARFRFPHETCGGCRECEAFAQLTNITWGKPFQKGASILVQAIETLLLSVRKNFNPQMENNLCGDALKDKLYGRHITDSNEKFAAFEKELSHITVDQITARSYPRLKQHIRDMVDEIQSSCFSENDIIEK